MKKTLWIAMVGALAASVVAASAQGSGEVLSANAVGYIKKTLPAGGDLVAMSIPLSSMTETDIVFGRTSVAQEAPVGAIVSFWDEVNQVWAGGLKNTKGWSAGDSNRVIAAGEGFFLKNADAATEPFDVTITGEVPPDATIPRSIVGDGTLGILANPYPVDFKFGDSDLAQQATVGSIVSFWDEVNQVWAGGLKNTKGWSSGDSNRVVAAGEAFFLREAGAATTWNAAKPYTWP
ncbi:MAG: hypothetical protein EOL90_12415 [Spartobacteria bacterium]|nr:hypothetical protein [Spartobacteria bacterium]